MKKVREETEGEWVEAEGERGMDMEQESAEGPCYEGTYHI